MSFARKVKRHGKQSVKHKARLVAKLSKRMRDIETATRAAWREFKLDVFREWAAS